MATIPQVRAYWLPAEVALLEHVIVELWRRRHFGPRRVTSEKMTPEKREEIRAYRRAHPSLSQTEIATALHVNQGRVSEALHGWRQ
jgi:hypothetical protein